MNKFLLSLLVGTLIIVMTSCSIDKEIQSHNINCIKTYQQQKIKTPKDRSLFFSKTSYINNTSYGKNHFMIRNLGDGEVYIYDYNYNLIETIQGKYYDGAMSPEGDECFLVQNTGINNTENTKMYKKKIGKNFKKTLYFESNPATLFAHEVVKWSDEGIYFEKYILKGLNKLYLMKSDKSVELLYEAESKFEYFRDVMDGWVLIQNTDHGKVFKFNLNTKEKVEITDFSQSGTTIQDLSFFNSTDVLIGEEVYGFKNAKIFIFENNKKKYIQKGSLVGTINNGFVYKVYDSSSDEEDLNGLIYVKTMKETN